jgi:hypothetical protein
MGPDIIQNGIVTLAAIGAAWIVVRRLFVFVKPAAGAAPKCASCPAAQRQPVAQRLSSEPQPLTLIR